VGKLGEDRSVRLDPVYKAADGNRIPIPADFCTASILISDSTEILLWMVGPGRYRLLCGAHVDHPEISALRALIANREGPAEATEFDNNAATVAGARLKTGTLSVSTGKERRLSVPDILMELLNIRREGKAVVVLDGRFVEIWSVEAFEASFNTPTGDLL
jgi:DNA-binding transcriptional regulator/RsmH inhibitor MraZ